ncbi:MAG: 16S rRNA (uracil(1498)-N(3))-methyltransferase [Firmicutes bacterium]|uniref:Ribosomal RNA small subunit methyltransferase E n=1 Tax=Melghirimyces thermohalophilus TaxID=1236220 RepID=A0A1G6P349_9BACL|nr:16S rRNA (uracil(1498)-N(3))-methyltransferase [Melghirimyces thermohalophilus]MDA8354295.1 16S rRNA (uracil(1498)-N(3))-methyltransferase [Bacillota bacterium]SDC74024.1 16S rRNA (uracil1498-N3)-methyltransferase [Melghirimyces thermohalophilus]
MQRYFVDPNAIVADRITIRGDDVHHIKNVMRMTAGDPLVCCDGQGTDYVAEVVSVAEGEVLCQIKEETPSRGEPDVCVTIAFSLPKGDKPEWVLQKGTELGAHSFLPFTSVRTVVKLNQKKAVKKQARWQRITKEAAEQSQRGMIPQVELPLTWKELLARFSSYDKVLFAYEKGGRPLGQVLEDEDRQRLLVVTGPEGGFSEKEAEDAVASGAVPTHLGPRILRAETAPLAILASILYSSGELGGEPL